MIAIVDYGVGNLFSLRSSLEYIGAECVVTSDPAAIGRADRVILPGVGAFGDAAAALRQTGLNQAVIRTAAEGRPLLGICLGMQLLFEKSFEYGEHAGLGLIPGEIVGLSPALRGERLKVPHMGWNDLVFSLDSPLLRLVSEHIFVYYVHSFYAPVSDYTAAWSQYGSVRVSGVVQNGNVYGTQFHPEKSGDTGLLILRAFSEI